MTLLHNIDISHFLTYLEPIVRRGLQPPIISGVQPQFSSLSRQDVVYFEWYELEKKGIERYRQMLMQNAPTEIAIGLREEYVQQHAHVFMEYNVEKRYPGFKDSLRRIGIRDDDGSLGQGKDRWNNQVVCTETIPVEAFEAVVVKKYDQNGEERLVKIPKTGKEKRFGEGLVEVFPASVGIYLGKRDGNRYEIECLREAGK